MKYLRPNMVNVPSVPKFPRVIIPVVQAIAFLGTWVLKRLSVSSDRINFDYYLPAKSIIEAINYPLVVSWRSLDYGLSRLGVNPKSGSVSAVVELAAGFAFLASIVLFWYLVVKESELRLQGKSVFRFSGWIGSGFAIAVLFCAGVSALVSAYVDARTKIPFMLRNGSLIGLLVTIVPEMFLCVWAFVLTAMSIRDLRGLKQTRSSNPQASG